MSSTSNAEGLVVRVGGKGRTEVLELLRDRGVQLNAYAETLFAHSSFDASECRVVCIVQRTVEQLGLDNGGTQPEVFAAARRQGFELCPLATGPYLRLAMLDQPNAPDSVLSAGRSPAGALHIASEPVSENVEYPKGFYLRVVDDQPWLRGYCCDDTYVLTPEQHFAFVLPPSA